MFHQLRAVCKVQPGLRRFFFRAASRRAMYRRKRRFGDVRSQEAEQGVGRYGDAIPAGWTCRQTYLRLIQTKWQFRH